MLLRRVPLLRRLDVVPFVAMYACLFAAYLSVAPAASPPGAGATNVPPSVGDDAAAATAAAGEVGGSAGAGGSPPTPVAVLAVFVAAALLAVTHILVGLFEFWSVQFKARVGWVQVRRAAAVMCGARCAGARARGSMGVRPVWLFPRGASARCLTRDVTWSGPPPLPRLRPLRPRSASSWFPPRTTAPRRCAPCCPPPAVRGQRRRARRGPRRRAPCPCFAGPQYPPCGLTSSTYGTASFRQRPRQVCAGEDCGHGVSHSARAASGPPLGG